MKIRISTIGLLTLLASYSGQVLSVGYFQYCNERYGFCVDVAQQLAMGHPPPNNDGREFSDRNGFMMTASGINNSLDETLDAEIQSQEQHFDTLTYKVKKQNWYVLSGYVGSYIVYQKAYVGPGSINHLYIRYPAALKDDYSAIVTRTSRSFKPGDTKVSH
jgi:serine/threonine-protein kinase